MDELFYRRRKKRVDLHGLARKLLRNKRVIAALVLGVPLALFLLFGSRGIVQRVRLQNQKVDLEAKIREANAETQRLSAELKALDGDRKTIEKVAREKYGMLREGETVYRVNRKDK